MRLGFLFNHDQVHQVAHSLPIAVALARRRPDLEIIVATTNQRLSAEVIRLSEGMIGSGLQLVELGLRQVASKAVAGALEALIPASKLLLYRDNLDFFRSLDVLVVAEKTSLVLKTRYGLKDLKIVHTRHGAGDRAIGFDKASALFDHVLVSGPKIRERLIRDAGVAPETISVVGYPKFDLAPPRPALPFVDEARPVVLYNPHVSPHLSSWYDEGRAVLDWFVEHEEYQLIFAPHVMLFERPFVVTIDKLRIDHAGRIADKYLRAANIHVDLGSRASTTMTYTQRADIYLGDVSSQIYEFLLHPRPCVFLNSHGFDWRGDPNFEHWLAGPVINRAAELGAGLAKSVSEHATIWRPVQEALFARSFDLTAEPSSVRAARALARFAGLDWPEAAGEPLLAVAG